MTNSCRCAIQPLAKSPHGCCAQEVRKRCAELELPLMEEYDYSKDDDTMPRVEISLKPSTNVRDYQKQALSKVLSNRCVSPRLTARRRRAKSGIIVLPCGAGKSLVGVLCIETVKRPSIVLCINSYPRSHVIALSSVSRFAAQNLGEAVVPRIPQLDER